MENEHQGVPEKLDNKQGLGQGLSSALSVVSLINIGVQIVLFLKATTVDGDIAIAGFSLFFLALFGLAYYLSIKQSRPKVVFISSIACSLLSCVGGIVLFFGFSVPIEQSAAISLASFVFTLLISGPALLVSKGWKHEK